jgi:hypothetical protein
MPVAAEAGVIVGFQDVTFDAESGHSGRYCDKAEDQSEDAMAEGGS